MSDAPAPYPPLDGSQPCAQFDVELFFPEKGMSHRSAAEMAQITSLCRSCHFAADCLDYALTHDVSGIWAGTTGLRRKQLRQAYGIRAVTVKVWEESA